MSTTDRWGARWCTHRRVVSTVLLVLVAAGWWTFLRPSALGGPLTLVTVAGVSMQPSFYTGDVAVMRETGHYDKGDVIAFRAEAVPGGSGAFVIHRVVGGNATTGYVTRGDNNDWDDPWRPTEDKVAGELWFSIPGAGRGLRWLGQPLHLGAVLAGIAAGLVMLGEPKAPGGRKAAGVRQEAVSA